MQRYLALAFLFLQITSALGKVFSGNGKILFTYHTEFFTRGSRIIYRPEKHNKYSILGKGVDAKIAYRRVDQVAGENEEIDEDFLRDKKCWDKMTWDYKGSYYYYETLTEDVYPGAEFAYGIAIYDENCDEIYEDTNRFYQVPSQLETCTLDKDCKNYDDYICSEALKLHGKEGDPSSNSDMTRLIGIVIVSSVTVILCVLVCIIFKTKSGQRTTEKCLRILPCCTSQYESSNHEMEQEKFTDSLVPLPTLDRVVIESNRNLGTNLILVKHGNNQSNQSEPTSLKIPLEKETPPPVKVVSDHPYNQDVEREHLPEKY